MKKTKKGKGSGGGGKAGVVLEQEVQDKAIDYIRLRNIDRLNQMLAEGSEEIHFLNKFHTKLSRTALMIAAEEGYVDGVRALLDAKAKVQLRELNKEGMTAFLIAARWGYTNILDYLAQSGAEINDTTNTKKETPLMLACRWGHIDSALYIISIEASLHDQNTSIETALTISLKYEHFKISKELLEKGCDINLQGVNGNTTLLRSAFDGRDTTVSFILANKGDVSIKNQNGESAFIIACKHGHTNIAQMLLDNHAFINDVDNLGRTSLMYAVMNSKVEIVNMLLSMKADVNMVDLYGYGALSFACLHKKGLPLVTILLEAGVHIDAMDKSYSTALLHACRKGNMEVVEYLVAKGGANYSLVNIDNHTPLDVCPNEDHKEEFQRIMDKHPLSGRPISYMKKNPGVKEIPTWVKRINANRLLDI